LRGTRWVTLLDLLEPGSRRTEVGHGGRHEHDIAVLEGLLAGPGKLRGGLHLDDVDPGRRRHRHRTGHEGYSRTPGGSFRRQGKAHPSRRAVADVAHGGDRLTRS